jgi:hypothetical protein
MEDRAMAHMPKKLHHILPRLYLRGFADELKPSFIWEYTKGRPFSPGRVASRHSPALTPISKASSVPYAYGYMRRDGTFDPDTYENKLEKSEKPSDFILKKIRSRIMVTPSEKEIFASYVYMMHRRVPKEPGEVAKIWAETVKGSRAIAIIKSPKIQDALTTERRAEVAALIADYEAEPQKEVLLRAMTAEASSVMAYLRKMRWRFLVASGPSLFITGDYPVFTSSLGLKKLPAELTFPVSSDVTLHASWQPGPEGFFPVPEEYVRQLNNRTVSRAKVVFHAKSEEWVTTILNKNNHPIFLLDVSGSLSTLWRYRDLDVPETWLA